MKSHCSNFTLALAAHLLAAGVAGADEPIVFSKPANLPTEQANSFMDQVPHRMSDASAAPTPIFGRPGASFDQLPGAQPAPQFTMQQLRQLQKNLDEKKNWTLLTPEEILGVPTAAKILGLPDPNNDGLSVQERYLRRQERQRNFAATNSLRAAGSFAASDNPFRKPNSGQPPFGQNAPNNYFGQAANSLTPAAEDAAAKAGGTFWKSAFNPQPSVLNKSDLEAVAAMERARAMMEPPPAVKPVATAIYKPATPVRDPNMQAMQAYNPAGNSFRPVQDTVGRPTGILPLPTVTGFRTQTSVPEKRKPLVNLPPWLADDEKPPTGPPVRKF